MRTVTDAMRSLQLHFSEILTDFDVRIQREEPFERPLVTVQPLGPLQSRGSFHTIENTQAFDIWVYPDNGENPSDGRIKASDTIQAIVYGFRRPLEPVTGPTRDGRARPWRVPMFDYAELAWNEGLAEDAEPTNYLRIDETSFDITDNLDPDDDTMHSISVDLRAVWRDQGEDWVNHPVEEVTQTVIGS